MACISKHGTELRIGASVTVNGKRGILRYLGTTICRVSFDHSDKLGRACWIKDVNLARMEVR